MLRFRILPAHLWTPAYAKLAPDGAQTSNAVVASAVRIAKALQGHTADNVGVSLLSFQYEDYKKLSPSRTPCIIFVMPPHPGGGQQPFGLRSGGAPSHRKQLKEQKTDKSQLCTIDRMKEMAKKGDGLSVSGT